MALLTKKQMAFLDEYFTNGFNGSAAYKTVFKCKTDGTARSCSYTLLKDPDIKKEIERRQNEIQQKYNVKKEEIIKELIEIIRADLCDFIEIVEDEEEYQKLKFETGIIETKTRTIYKTIPKPTNQLTPTQRKLIKSIKQTRTGIEIQLYEKDKAIDMLAKMSGLYNENISMSTTINTDFLKDKTDEELLELLKDYNNEE